MSRILGDYLSGSSIIITNHQYDVKKKGNVRYHYPLCTLLTNYFKWVFNMKFLTRQYNLNININSD